MISLSPAEAPTKWCYLCELDLPRGAWSPSAWAASGAKCRECQRRYLRAYAQGEALPRAREGRRARRRECDDQAPEGARWCPGCELYVLKNEWPPSALKNKGGYCNKCTAEYNSKWNAKNNPRVTHECLHEGCRRLTRHDTCRSHRPTCDRPPRVRPIGTDYTAVHNQLRIKRGPARLLICANCGSPASEWAYDQLDPDERVDLNTSGRPVRYSTDLAHYRPLCRPCHRTESPERRPAPVAPSIEFVPGIVEPLPVIRPYEWKTRGPIPPLIDLRKPDERTGRRRRCSVCGMIKDEGAFGWRSRDHKYRQSRCRRCDARLGWTRHATRPARTPRTRTTGDYRKHRERAIAVYGGQCVWCGATDDLEFDHPDNDGAAHRRVEPTNAMLRRISRTGRPLDDWRLQLLCVPCHRGDGWTQRRAEGRPGIVSA